MPMSRGTGKYSGSLEISGFCCLGYRRQPSSFLFLLGLIGLAFAFADIGGTMGLDRSQSIVIATRQACRRKLVAAVFVGSAVSQPRPACRGGRIRQFTCTLRPQLLQFWGRKNVFTRPGSKGEILAGSRCFPLCPRKRTQIGHRAMSERCQERKSIVVGACERARFLFGGIWITLEKPAATLESS